ncbi:uncharacterized protein KGF55_002510 [Candida pseudojiufengensis]|uniref:uncharacterized protein n=1 Tax=Candida pseudojiufengensis TaxID=497109 RepID=UPI002224D933|nr:uncharacterized protein KGF55_002510 [Candida pseudojiufengensis]KAI5963630.1 hypothetical protein KGF55_002510 [Candida pseudojiufengensis]
MILPHTLFIILVIFINLTDAIDLSFLGVEQPNYYQKGQQVDLLVNKIESDKTQLPYGYYSLPFVCPPMNGAKPLHLSLGEILRGDRIWQSSYNLKFGIDESCLRLCDLKASENGIRRASNLIKDGYVVHWSIDDLPGATTFQTSNQGSKYYAAGFPLGFVENDISYIYNHVMLVIRYHSLSPQKNIIVGFEVYPKSVINEECPGSSKDYKNFALKYQTNKDGNLKKERTLIPYTYSVYWREDNTIDYESRWDLYYEHDFQNSKKKIHWFSFINSIILIFLVSLIVMILFYKILQKDIQMNNNEINLPLNEKDIDNISEKKIGGGGNNWRNLINEVHTIPKNEIILTTLVSGGIQMLIVIIGVIILLTLNSIAFFAKNSFFDTHKGAFFSLSIFCFLGSGLLSSFVGIILHKFFQNENLNKSYSPYKCVLYSLLFSAVLPLFLFLLMLILNFFVWAEDSSTALPFGTIVIFVLLFILVQCPLGIIGGFYGNNYKFKNYKYDTTTPSTPLSPREFNHTRKFSIKSILKSFSLISYFKNVLIFGLIPFGIVYVELLFIFNSVWLEKTTFYYMYGFLIITISMLIIIIIEQTIISIYISLIYFNNPNWSWLSFQNGFSIGWYIYLYSFYYFFKILNIDDFISSILFFSYMALACFIIGIACGSIGVLTGLVFISKIYKAVKLE